MQPINARAGSLDYDLGNTDLWEYVFIDPRSKPADGKPGEDDQKPDEDAGHGDDDDEDEGNLLDLPPSWVSKLELSRSDFKLRYPPDGARTTLYHRAKLELFAENLDDQGLVSRLLKYDDDERTAVVECVEKFKHRRDKLHRRRRFPTEAKLVEEFLPGRPGALAILTEKAGRRRELAFHHAARQDGLVSRTDDIGEKIVEIYKGRPDRLVYRAAAVTRDRAAGSAKVQYTLPGGEASGDLVVKKMTQKFDRNPTAEATGDAPRPRGDDDPSRKRPRAQSDASILRENARERGPTPRSLEKTRRRASGRRCKSGRSTSTRAASRRSSTTRTWPSRGRRGRTIKIGRRRKARRRRPTTTRPRPARRR